ncbi:MAG: winged helix-turn-helix domain-containing protein [Patescibacteria group bacterium]
MLDTLVTSKTRLKLILKFFLNPHCSAYLRGLAEEFGESSNAVRLELNRFEQAGLLESEADGNKKLYRTNVIHPLYNDIHSIISKTIGIDQIIDEVVAESLINRKIRYLILSPSEAGAHLGDGKRAMLIWKKEL